MRLLLCCLALLAAVNVWAETEYWVSVASASDLEVAEAVQKEAESRLPEAFSLQPADTTKGFFYRVIAGPFFSQGSAEQLVEAAKGEGFSEAWVVVVKRDIEDSYRSYSEPLPLESATDSDDEYRTDGALEIPRGMDTGKPKRSVVDEPPPGYKLNKLKRDQAGIDWASPLFSRSPGRIRWLISSWSNCAIG
jgi:hypothetical protein